jgi:hypothetical protein
MKTVYSVLALTICLFTASSYSQGFSNLNFEDAVIVPDPSSPNYPYAVYASNAIPGWTAYVGPTPQTDIIYNTLSLGATSVSILGQNGVPSSLSGAYSINLYGGQTASSASISQTGLVPAGVMSLLFKAQYSGPPGGTLLALLGGQDIPFSAISNGPNYTLYGASISGFSGQTEQLSFSAAEGVNNYWTIDDIEFSSQPIPEPNSPLLLGLGVSLITLRFLRRR